MTFTVETKGHYDFINITEQIAAVVKESGVSTGIAYVFVLHTTAALTIMEWEEGIMEDMKIAFEKWAPEKADYKHHLRSHAVHEPDGNGAAHIKSAIIGPDVSMPIDGGALQLGSWQQIALIDFDERPRTREISIKIIAAD